MRFLASSAPRSQAMQPALAIARTAAALRKLFTVNPRADVASPLDLQQLGFLGTPKSCADGADSPERAHHRSSGGSGGGEPSYDFIGRTDCQYSSVPCQCEDRCNQKDTRSVFTISRRSVKWREIPWR